MEGRSLSAVVLAAGQGTRMRSARPKPLHHLCGQAMVVHVLGALAGVGVERSVVVVGPGGEVAFRAELSHPGLAPPQVELALQALPRGTGDALAAGLGPLAGRAGGDVVVLPGDAPLVRPETLVGLVADHRRTGSAATLLTARLADPRGYGRVVRGVGGGVTRIVEEADASPEVAALDEVATSVYCFKEDLVSGALARVGEDNAKSERYLTDAIGLLAGDGHAVSTVMVGDPAEVQGVNDRAQLAAAEAHLRARINHGWMMQGVTMIDPAHTYLDAGVRLSPDVVLGPGAVLRGTTVVGEGAEIGPGVHLVDCRVGPGATVGPYAWLGPGAEVPPGAVTGPFYTDPGSGRSPPTGR